ncbi:zeta toxin family protein [Streptomyces mexicanus]|uniref:UDP-N-acetylglucosamine kinase n=1 Tax=Streptomyces mexicanus TaxID=178566 RepID=A0A7X1I8L9_9ACTN|nr:zeta toxin family protein [Streptomyces mexicanus]MBC2869793.1 zeta toxin family protein [Streptomyces mexicanus]
MSQDDASRYQLPAEENRRIFAADIVPELLTGPTPQDPPTAVFLLGQPGAGKTRVAQLVAEQLDARGGFADIDSDLYKPYHPQYAELMARDDRLMALYTGPDGRAWMRQAQQFVRGEDPLSGGRKLNALIQEIAMDPEFLAGTMRQYRAVGARTEVFVLAVSQALSEQGILNRYYEQVRDRGQGRLTVPEKAAASYTGIAVSCEVIARQGLADYAAVYRRGESIPRYAASAAELSAEPLALRQVLERERNRPWTPEESQDFRAVQQKLREGLPADFGPQLDRIDELARPLLAPQSSGSPRVSSAAARSRSVTASKRPAQPEQGVGPTGRSMPRHGPEGPEQRRGRAK